MRLFIVYTISFVLCIISTSCNDTNDYALDPNNQSNSSDSSGSGGSGGCGGVTTLGLRNDMAVSPCLMP